MVAQHATFLCLCADKRLIKRKQNLVQLKHIVVSVYQEILHYHIELTAMGQGKPCSADKVLRFIYIQFQCKGKGQCCCLRWLVVHIISDFRKQLSIHICLFIDYRVFFLCGQSIAEAFQSIHLHIYYIISYYFKRYRQPPYSKAGRLILQHIQIHIQSCINVSCKQVFHC